MARKPRNYAAEYARRIARAKQKGYSKSVARGHAPKGKAGIKVAKFLRLKPGDSIGLEERDSRGRLKTVVKDARKVFGKKPYREDGELSAQYEEKLRELQKQGGRFEWTDVDEFLASMNSLGLTERDAYTHWFSP